MKLSEIQIDDDLRRELKSIYTEIFILDKGDRFTDLGILLESIEKKYGRDTLLQVETAEDLLSIMNHVDTTND